jgi:hypothetical protein
MNILDLQDKLKNFSQDQLVQEMQMPTGQLPQFLLLNEITRRKKMQDSYAQQQDQAQQQTTVAQDAINAAGIPQGAAQQLAGTMAPQTDMAGNTGAVAQQVMPQAPQPVQGMAEGGIVALQEGGRVTAPRLVVRNGRQMLEMPDGSVVSLSRSQQAMLDRELERTPPMVGAEVAEMAMPSIGDVPAITAPRVDQAPARVAQPGLLAVPALGDSRPAGLSPTTFTDMIAMDAPSMDGVPAVGLDVAPAASRQAPGLRAGAGMVPPSAVDTAMPGPTAPRAAPTRMMETDDARDIRASMAAYAPSLFGAVPTGEGQAFNFDTSPLVPATPVAGPNAPMAGTDPRGLGTIISETLSGEDPKATADRLLESGQINQEQYNRYIFGSSGERNRVIREALGYEEPRVPTPQSATPASTAPAGGDPLAESIASAEEAAALRDSMNITESLRTDEDKSEAANAAREALTAPATATPGGGGGGGGGGIASVARGAGAPSDFEQELMTMLAAREKRAEQDKWLALAQVGMQLMSSTQPTFGGALGEAGAAGLGALREGQAGSEADRLGLLSAIEQSRMGREKMDLERQALAARSAAGGRDRAIPAAALGALGDQITAISERLSDSLNPVTPEQRTVLSDQLAGLQQQQTALNAMYFGQYGVAAPQMTTTAPEIIDVRN